MNKDTESAGGLAAKMDGRELEEAAFGAVFKTGGISRAVGCD